MRLINHNTTIFITIFITTSYCENDAPKYCRKVSSIRSDGLFKIVAFIPIYNEYPEKLNSEGIMRSEVLRFVINEFNEKYGENIIGYTIFDTCFGESDVITEGLLQVLIDNDDHENVLQNNSILSTQCHCLPRNKELSSVIGIISSLSSTTAHINRFLSYHRLPLISYSSTSPELSDSSLYPYLYRTIVNDKFQAMFMKKILLKLNWTFITIINSDDTYGRAGADALTFSNSICSHLKKTLPLPANNSVIQPIMEAIRDKIKSSVIVLWGHIDLAKAILKAAVSNKIEDKTWILSESVGLDPWFLKEDTGLKGDILVVIPNGGYYEKFENHFLNMTLKRSNHSPWLKTFFNKHGVTSTSGLTTKLRKFRNNFPLQFAGFTYTAVTTYLKAFLNYVSETSKCDLFLNKSLCKPHPIQGHRNFADKYIKTIKFKDLLDEDFQFDENGDAQYSAFELHMVRKDLNRFELIANWSSSRTDISLKEIFWELDVSKKTSKCSEECKAGFFSIPNGKAEVRQCCWECAQCLEGTVKENPGKGECRACADTHSNNDNNTKCIPLVDVFIEYGDAMGFTIFAISILGVGLTCFVIAVFIVQRNSRIVRSTNLIPSLLQLIIHNLLFTLPYLFFDENTPEKCATRTFCVGLLFTLIISITLSKISHVSNLFRLKHRMNDRERNQMKTKQVVIIFVPVLIQISFMIILMSIHPIEVKRVSLDNFKFEIHRHCDVDFHLAGQLIFLSVLQALCCVKSFLARKLPDIYNETKYISFAMFTSLLVMLLSVPLIGSYQTSQEKNFVLAIVILAANLLILLILYSYKIYFIFCGVEKKRTPSRTGALSKFYKSSRHISTVTIDSVFSN